MKTSKVLVTVILVFAVLLTQIGAVFAAPASETTLLSGTVQSITLETDVNTAITIVLVTIAEPNNTSQTVRLSVDTAKALGLITADENGTPVINPDAIGKTVQIDPKTVIADDEADLHPVGDALATFFGEITDYEIIMAAHADGNGFGVIAQALWLTQKLEGDSETFLAILKAKETGDYSAFVLEDGTSPKNWGQFRKAILEGDKGTLGMVVSNKDKEKNNNSNGNGQGNDDDNGNKGKDKDKDNNGNGNKDKDKDKGKDK
jgi:hypothetical protein